jgi:hypothetical protein
MDEQLHLLVSLQDLDTLIRETMDVERRAELEKMGFSLDNLEPLRAARRSWRSRSTPAIRVYERLPPSTAARWSGGGKNAPRCFQSVPSFSSRGHRGTPVKVCENCDGSSIAQCLAARGMERPAPWPARSPGGRACP